MATFKPKVGGMTIDTSSHKQSRTTIENTVEKKKECGGDANKAKSGG